MIIPPDIQGEFYCLFSNIYLTTLELYSKILLKERGRCFMKKLCYNCSCELQQEDKFCPNCGADTVVFCPHCGSRRQPGSKFCFGCGFNFSTQPAPAALVQQPQTVPLTENKNYIPVVPILLIILILIAGTFAGLYITRDINGLGLFS